MRIACISVKQLFDAFDHRIPLNLDSRVTIIHGLNGLGKTTLLKLVKSLCGARYHELLAVPFDELRLDFDDGSSVVVERQIDNSNNPGQPLFRKGELLQARYLINGVEEAQHPLPGRIDPEAMGPLLDVIDINIPNLRRMEESHWLLLPSRELLSLDEVIDRFGYRVPELVRRPNNAPHWLKRINKSINVLLIETQRLVAGRGSGKPKYESESPIAPAIAMHSGELASKIAEVETEYGSLSQTLDRTFPLRYVKQKATASMPDRELRDRFVVLESKRARLEAAGLLEKESSGFALPDEMDEATRGVMSVYVTDIEEKLSVFDNLAERIDLFKRIVDDRFAYKELRVSKKKGLRFFSTRSGRELDSSALSSGEQHEVVLLYELLFRVNENSLVMIDEPEISLHIAWQEEFLRDLQRIIALSPFDAVIATHSPQIVNDRWDLTVELAGPREDRA